MIEVVVALYLLFVPNLGEVQRLTSCGDHESAARMLAAIKPTPENFDQYSYLRATNAFLLNDKPTAAKWLGHLQDWSTSTTPSRYIALGHVMRETLKDWRPNDLGEVGREMRMVENRLQLARGGPQTQRLQTDIVGKLDKIIKDMEDQQNGGGGEGQPEGRQQAKKDGKDRGQGDPSNPMKDSEVGDARGEGKVNQRELKRLAENWGTLPPKEREKAMQTMTKDLPPRYRQIIEDYFKRLGKVEKSK